MKKVYLISIIILCRLLVFSQENFLKIQIEYDTIANSNNKNKALIKSNAAKSFKGVFLTFLYEYKFDKVVVCLNDKMVVNEIINTDKDSGFSKQFTKKLNPKVKDINLTVEVAGLKSNKVNIKRTKYLYFFYEREDKLLKIKATNEVLPSE